MDRKKLVFGLMAAALLVGTAQPVSADPETGKKMGRKLIRGVVNTFTGWVEVPIQAELSEKEYGWKGIPPGLGKGLFFALGRTMVGLYEIATFPLPMPEDYRPVVVPEFRIKVRPVTKEQPSLAP